MASASYLVFTKRFLRILGIFLTPDALYYLTVLFLVLLYGGHRASIHGKNPFCNSLSRSTFPPLSNLSGPPQVLIQISDLHVNDIGYGYSKQHLLAFEAQALPRWGPLASALVASGDLVHAIRRLPYPLHTRSAQFPGEWLWLDQFSSRVNRTLPWISTHGNHDSFGGHLPNQPHVPDVPSLLCPIANYSSSHPRLQHFKVDRSLHLIVLDTTPAHPLHRPLNFFGDASLIFGQLEKTLEEIHVEHSSIDFPGPNILIVGHYPSAIMTSGTLVHPLAKRQGSWQAPRFAAYLSGHLHDIYGLAKHGLSTISKYGSLELESTDMILSGAYRVFTFDQSILSFKTFSVRFQNPTPDPLRDIIIINLPQAGLCSGGAGTAALKSTHIRVLSPSADLDALGVTVVIDGQTVGTMSSFRHTCSNAVVSEPRDLATCYHLYGTEWDPSQYAVGAHFITFRSNNSVSSPYYFSLDGSPDPSFLSKMYVFMSAFFGLSDFEHILIDLAVISLLLSVTLSIPGIILGHNLSLAFGVFSFAILLGCPVIIAKNLSVMDEGVGLVGLWYSSLTSGAVSYSVDVSLIMARRVFWPVVVPSSYILAAQQLRLALVSRQLLMLLQVLCLWRCWSWCLEIAGSYGVFAAVFSPCCGVLFMLCSWSVAQGISKSHLISNGHHIVHA